MRGPPEQRFWARVAKTDGCWEWQGARNHANYGQINTGKGHRELAHRFSWELHFGPIAAGLNVCHRCDNPPCVRSDHLFLGSQHDNMADMAAKETRAGERHYGHKLTADDVRHCYAARVGAAWPNAGLAA